MTVLGALARPGPSNAIQVTPWGDWGPSGKTWAGSDVTELSATQLLTVYGCVRFICDGISTLPVDLLRKLPESGSVEVDKPALLVEPAPGLTMIEWITQFLASLLLAGNFYGYLAYRNGRVDQVIPIDPMRVQVRRERGRRVYWVDGERFSELEIGHVRGVMWPGSDVGLSPVEAARQSIGQGMSAQEYGARFFADGATMSGVIEVPGELAPDKAREMARAWSKRHGGKDKAHLPGVLQGGASWKQTGVTNDQAQFLETRRFTAAEIAASMFLIDPPEMGIGVEGQSLTYSNLEQRNIRKVQVTFLPWIVRLEQFLSSLMPGKQYVHLNVDGLLRGDQKTRMSSYAIGIQNQFMTPNEARAFEDWSPLPGGDEVRTVDAPSPEVTE